MINAALARLSVEYSEATRLRKTELLDEVMRTTGWNRDHARRRLRDAHTEVGAVAQRGRPRGSRKYSHQSVEALAFVWRVSGKPSGRHLSAIMLQLLERLQTFGALPAQYASPCVLRELHEMSSASIDRYLRPVRAREKVLEDNETRWSAPQVPVPLASKAGIADRAVGTIEVSMFSHESTAAGASCRLYTIRFEDAATGWEARRTVADNSPATVYSALDWFAAATPFTIRRLTFGAGAALLNWSLIAWSSRHGVEISPQNHEIDKLVTLSHAADEIRAEARELMRDEAQLFNAYWSALILQKNHVLTNTRPTDMISTATGRLYVYDQPRTPLERLLDSGALTDAQTNELLAIDRTINPAEISQELERIADVFSRNVDALRAGNERARSAERVRTGTLVTEREYASATRIA